MRIELSLFCLLLACSHASITSPDETLHDAGVFGLSDAVTLVFDAEHHEHANDATPIRDEMTAPDQLVSVCGNGVVESDEFCDDGNSVTELCDYGEPSCVVCAADCTEQAGETHLCGDGVIHESEQCDDGNENDTDGCRNTCLNATCGDGVVHAGVEACDDGNRTDTDACRNTCVNAVCGDGVVHNGIEACDDGNSSNVDGCTNACALPTCGDGFVQAGEECDDGNSVSEACDYGAESCVVCAADCTEQDGDTSLCGDGTLHDSEQCDDGNFINADRCTNTCRVNQICGGLPNTSMCRSLDDYTPGLDEHFMQNIDGCVFEIIAPTAEDWAEGEARIDRLIERIGNERNLADVLADLNREGARGITNYNAQRLRNHDWFGFNWNGGDRDVSYWYPQGITGSSDARANGWVNGRRLILVSWYHKTDDRPTKGARISLVDLTDPDDIRYRHLLLVEPYTTANGETNFGPTETDSGNALHVGGIVWYGRYLYVADTSRGIRVFDMTRLIEIPDHDDNDRVGITSNRTDAHGYVYVIPQIVRYTQSSLACPLRFSSLGLDRSTNPPTLISAEYRSDDIQARLVHWPIDIEDDRLLDINGAIRGRDAKAIAQDRVQGALSWNGNYYISSSSQYGHFGRIYRTRPGLESRRTAWVYGAEDLYYEHLSGLIWTPAEHPDFRDTVGIPLLPP